MLKKEAVELLEDIYASLAEADDEELGPDLAELRDRLANELGYDVDETVIVENDPDEENDEEEE